MDKKEREIFEEVINNLNALKERVDALEREVAGLKGFEEPVSDVNEVIDLEIDDLDLAPLEGDTDKKVKSTSFDDFLSDFEPVTKVHKEKVETPVVVSEVVSEEKATPTEEEVINPVEEMPVEEDKLEEEEVVEADPVEERPVEEKTVPEEIEEKVSSVEEPVVEESGLFGGFSLFGEVEEPEVKHVKKHKTLNDTAHSNKAVIDVMAEKLAWKHDMPGTQVKDIKSAISLNDRVLFISSLFREDSMLYQDTMRKLNAMTSLDEAVKYLGETFPEWNLESDSVYRFMMAVRRKLR